jgi:hypothetical protein
MHIHESKKMQHLTYLKVLMKYGSKAKDPGLVFSGNGGSGSGLHESASNTLVCRYLRIQAHWRVD